MREGLEYCDVQRDQGGKTFYAVEDISGNHAKKKEVDANTGTYLVGAAGLEPATPDLEGRCSIQMSYAPASLV